MCGVVFAKNADYQPEFLLSYLPVFMIMFVGLIVECIPLFLIIRALSNEQAVPFAAFQVYFFPPAFFLLLFFSYLPFYLIAVYTCSLFAYISQTKNE